MERHTSGTVDGQQGVAVTWKGLVVFLIAVWAVYGAYKAVEWLASLDEE